MLLIEQRFGLRRSSQSCATSFPGCLDLAGNAFDVPVTTLLGGIVRDRVPHAAHLFYKCEGAGGELGFGVDPKVTGWAADHKKAALNPEEIVTQAKAMVAEFGFKSIKVNVGVFEPAAQVAALKALHKAFGPNVSLRHDPNAPWSVPTATRWSAEFAKFFEHVEDPVHGQEAMAMVQRALKLTLATNICATSFTDLSGSARLGVELDHPILARAHDNFKRCRLTKCDDEIDVQKKVPGWRFSLEHW